MGYTTDFQGKFTLDRPLDDETFEFLTKMAETRRMKRNLGPEYGVEGEFYVDGAGMAGQAREDSIVDYNYPPRTQPGLWCQWVPTDDRMGIKWDGNEKFYEYTAWIEYLIDYILSPRGYVVNGTVEWVGEDAFNDQGKIVVIDNKVFTESR